MSALRGASPRELRVEIHVVLALGVPGPVLAHAALDELLPGLPVGPDLERRIEAQAQPRLREMLEDEPGPFAGRGVERPHRVREAARPAHDGDGAVLEAVHLIEPARLVA